MNSLNNNDSIEECPERSELEDYVSGDLSDAKTKEIETHIEDCFYCFDVLKGLEKATKAAPKIIEETTSEEVPHEIKTMAIFDDPGIVEYGQIWSTFHEDMKTHGSRYVIVTGVYDEHENEDNKDIQFIPISDSVNHNTNNDLFVPKQKSSIGFEFMAQAWCLQNMFISQLDKYYGRLDSEMRDQLRYVIFTALNLKAGEVPEGLIVGEPVVNYDDIRAKYMIKTLEETKYLTNPVLKMISEIEGKAVGKAAVASTSKHFGSLVNIIDLLIEKARKDKDVGEAVRFARKSAADLRMYMCMAGGAFYPQPALSVAAGDMKDEDKKESEVAEDVVKELFASDEQEFIFEVRFYKRSEEHAPYVLIRARKKTGNYTDNPPICLVKLWKGGDKHETEIKDPQFMFGNLLYAEFSLEEAETHKKSSGGKGDYTFRDFRWDYSIVVIAPRYENGWANEE